MEHAILENFTQWFSHEASSIFAPDNESDTVGNDSTDGNDSNEEPFDVLLDFFRSLYIEEIYGPHFYTNFIVSFVLCILGYITNILNVVVFLKTPMFNSINLFLMSLAISDIIYITTKFSHIVHYFAGFKMFPYYEWVVFFIASNFLENSFIYISNWLAAVTGMWRCISITLPHQIRELTSPIRAKMIIGLIIFLSFLFSTPILFMYSYQNENYESHIFYYLEYSNITVGQDRLFMKTFWGFQQLKGLIPMLIMVASTVWLIVILNRTRRQRIRILHKETRSSANHRITLMLTILLVLYWLSNLPDSFMFLIHIACPDDQKLQEDYEKHTEIIRIFVLINNSVSFFIYYGLGVDFRNTFHSIFLRRIGHRKRKSTFSGVSESSTVRSKSFDMGPLRKAPADSTLNPHFQELNQVIALKDITL